MLYITPFYLYVGISRNIIISDMRPQFILGIIELQQ